MQPFAGLHPSTTRPILTPKLEQRSFCSAQNHTSLGVKFAYGVVFAGDPSKEKAGNFTWYQEVSDFLIANFKFAVHSDSSYGRVRKAVQTRKENPFHSRLAQRCRRIGRYQLFRRPSGCAERETPSGVSIAISTATAAQQLTVMVMLGGWLFIIA